MVWIIATMMGCGMTEHDACAARTTILCGCGEYECASPAEVEAMIDGLCEYTEDDNKLLLGDEKGFARCLESELESTCESSESFLECCEAYPGHAGCL